MSDQSVLQVIPYMGMKLKIHYFLLSFLKVIPYMGMKLYRLLKIPIIVQSYPLYGNEISASMECQLFNTGFIPYMGMKSFVATYSTI